MAALTGFDTALQMTRHAQALRRQGIDFVMRYYSHNAAKNLGMELRQPAGPESGILQLAVAIHRLRRLEGVCQRAPL